MFQASPAAARSSRSRDERVDDVVPGQPRRCDEPDDADDDEHRADAADGAPAVARQPDREPEGGEREERQHPGERLQELEHVLRRVELVGAEDHDLAGVGGNPVHDLVADADPVGGLDHDRAEVETHLALLGRDTGAASLEHLDERRVRLLERGLEEVLEDRLLERAVDDLVRRLAQAGGRGAGQPLVVGRKLVLHLRLHVDVGEELVDRPVRDRASGSGRCRAASSTCP